MSYKSKHTGAQVDEAVNKVLNGEVGGGADWNAQEGEAGYIENRTHCSKTIFSKFIEPDSELSEYNTEIKNTDVDKFYNINYIEILVNDAVLEVFPVHFNYYETNIISKYIREEEVTITVSCVDKDGDRTIKVEFSEKPLNNDIITIGILGLNVSVLSEKYIPDTVLKTTPQTLTDENKNQALANLGIDPVVWKYMCNPHIVELDKSNYEFNNAIPKELSDKIYQNGKFNHLVLSTVLIKIYEELEEVGNVWKVERITEYNEIGNVIFDKTEFGYDPKTRLFVV